MNSAKRRLPQASREVCREVCWLVTQFVARDHEAATEVRRILDGVSQTMGSEPGARSYTVVLDLDDDRSTWVLEEWNSVADAQRHENTTSGGDGARRLQSLLIEPYRPRT